MAQITGPKVTDPHLWHAAVLTTDESDRDAHINDITAYGDRYDRLLLLKKEDPQAHEIRRTFGKTFATVATELCSRAENEVLADDERATLFGAVSGLKFENGQRMLPYLEQADMQLYIDRWAHYTRSHRPVHELIFALTERVDELAESRRDLMEELAQADTLDILDASLLAERIEG